MGTCPKCNGEISYVEQYSKWYCYACKEYVEPAGQQVSPPQAAAPAAPAAGGALKFKTVHSPSFTALILRLEQGQSVVAEKGAMMYKHRSIDIQTSGRKGGLLEGLVTSALGGESFFVNTFTASQGGGELALVSPLMGDIKEIDVSGWPMVLFRL